MEKVFFRNIFPAEIFFLASNLLKRRTRLNNFQIVLSIKVEFFIKTWLNYYQNGRKIDITIFVIHFSPILNFPISNYQPLSTHYTSREFLIFFLHGFALNRPIDNNNNNNDNNSLTSPPFFFDRRWIKIAAQTLGRIIREHGRDNNKAVKRFANVFRIFHHLWREEHSSVQRENYNKSWNSEAR